jgi:hypothetical protein
MLSVALNHANRDRVTIHPSKTKAVIFNKQNAIIRSNLHWELGDKTVCPSEETTQLARIELKENQLNVEARMSLARRTLYSLIINTGVHDSNGHSQQISYENPEEFQIASKQNSQRSYLSTTSGSRNP